MSSAFENAMSDSQADNYTQQYPVSPLQTLGERVDRVIKTINDEVENSARSARLFPSEAGDQYAGIRHLETSRRKFVRAVEALIEKYQI